VQYEWDERKRSENVRKHGVDFEEALRFKWDAALIEIDNRRDYGEPRMSAIAPIEDRLYMMTHRGGFIRIISLRKANLREWRKYVKETKIDPTY